MSMKYIFLFLLLPLFMQGCLMSLAGANAGLNSNFLDKIIPNPTYADKMRSYEQDKLLFRCEDELTYSSLPCLEESIHVKDCTIDYYRSVSLNYVCENVNNSKVFHFYVDAVKEDGTSVKRYTKDVIVP